MKKLFLFILIFTVASIFGQTSLTKLIISSNISSYYIYVDGRLSGIGKTELSLPEGEYHICIKESLLKWTGREITDVIKIDNSTGKIEKNYSFAEQTLINSIPQDARISVRDSIIGYTPLFINSGIKNLTLLKDNYGPLNVNLTGVKEFNLGNRVNGSNGTFVKSPWFKVLLGTAAVIGTVAAYYKIQADKSYDIYLTNRSSATLDEVNRYDAISGIALGALQINFGVLLYLLLSD